MPRQPTMINVETGGKKVEGIVAANKDGFAYFVNAQTGQPVFPIEEKPVPQNQKLLATYPTQPIPAMPPFVPPKANPEQFQVIKEGLEKSAAAAKVPVPTIVTGTGYNGSSLFVPFSEYGEATIAESRNASGGAQEGDLSYDPETGDYYVCSHLSPEVGSIQSEKTNPTGGETYGTSKFGLSFTLSRIDARGYVTAYNMQTGQIVWADELPHECYASGSTVTKGGVLFTGSAEGEIRAYNAASGQELWHFGIGAGPSMISVYEFAGKERVSIYGGGSDFEATKHGDFLWQFSLNGTGPGPKECTECSPKGLSEKGPWPPSFPYGPVL